MQEIYQSDRAKDKERENGAHSITISNKRQISMTEIESVISFSPHELILQTGGGKITVTGEELKIAEFSKTTGKFTAAGKILSVRYGGENKLKKIFR